MDQDLKASSSSMGDDCSSQSSGNELEDTMSDLRRGPWTLEEDFTLMNYISIHGEGRWNSLATSAGLKRTGKSCRLRWLNYLRPDVRRGNISLEEQLLILELHSQWGNRWSKIAQHLPGRTDNEIKNYWRTRVQKQAKQLKCDVNSKQFKDTMRCLWMPRLIERIQATAAATSSTTPTPVPMPVSTNYGNTGVVNQLAHLNSYGNMEVNQTSFTPENSSTTAGSTDSFSGTQIVSPVSDLNDCYSYPATNHSSTGQDYFQSNWFSRYDDSLTSPAGYFNQGLECQSMDQNNQWMNAGNVSDCLWNIEDSGFLEQQLNSKLE